MRSIYILLLAGVLALSSHITYAQATQKAEKSSTTKKAKTMNVLFVLTSHDALGNTGEKTGLWLEEFATPYYFLTDKGINVTIASPKGGQPPIDPRSNQPERSTTSTKRFYADEATQKKLRESLPLKDVDQKNYDAVFYPGGHGPLFDLATDRQSINLIESFYRNDKPVAFVCHAPGVLKNVKDPSGAPLVKGKKVTGFTNTEEEAVKLTNVVPFLVENALKENGGIYQRGADWSAFAVEDGLLITGQNPASSELVAEKLLHQLQK